MKLLHSYKRCTNFRTQNRLMQNDPSTKRILKWCQYEIANVEYTARIRYIRYTFKI